LHISLIYFISQCFFLPKNRKIDSIMRQHTHTHTWGTEPIQTQTVAAWKVGEQRLTGEQTKSSPQKHIYHTIPYHTIYGTIWGGGAQPMAPPKVGFALTSIIHRMFRFERFTLTDYELRLSECEWAKRIKPWNFPVPKDPSD